MRRAQRRIGHAERIEKGAQPLEKARPGLGVAALAAIGVANRTCSSRRSFDTGTPTNANDAEACSMTRPCECGIDARPKRPFGFRREPMDDDPRSRAGPITQRGDPQGD